MNLNYAHYAHHYAHLAYLKSALQLRETCHHWINYEIYDTLSDDLKKKYLDQFPGPEFSLVLVDGKWVGKIRCKANHHDQAHLFHCDCSENYKKSLKQFTKAFNELHTLQMQNHTNRH